MAAKKSKNAVDDGPAPDGPAPDEPEGGVEIVPLLIFRPGRARPPWGNQYVSGVMDRTTSSHPTTFPGVPICVKSRAYADMIIGGGLAKYIDDFRLTDLPVSFRGECDNAARWAHTLNTEDDG